MPTTAPRIPSEDLQLRNIPPKGNIIYSQQQEDLNKGKEILQELTKSIEDLKIES